MNPEIVLTDFSHALAQFRDALTVKADHDVIRAGCIQYFEFTFELAWKAIESAAEQEGLNPGGSPRSCLRTAFAQEWIDDEAIWLEMPDARNRMSHTDDAREALGIYDRLPAFIEPMVMLVARLEQRL